MSRVLIGKTLGLNEIRQNILLNTDENSKENGFNQVATKGVAQSSNYYNMGLYDSIVSNNGVVTITRKTGKLVLGSNVKQSSVRAYNVGSSTVAYFYVNYTHNGKGTYGDNALGMVNEVNNWNFEKTTPANFNNGSITNKIVTASASIGFKIQGVTTLAQFMQYLQNKPFVLEYELKDDFAYTENLIENVPIRVATQEELFYWNNEWKNTLNVAKTLYPSYTLAGAAKVVGRATLDIGKKYTLSFQGEKTGSAAQTGNGGWIVLPSDEPNFTSSYSAAFTQAVSSGGRTHEGTSVNESWAFTANKKYLLIIVGTNGYNATFSLKNLMLLDHKYNYANTSFYGEIIHENRVPLYMSTENVSPAEIIGGDWESIGSLTVGQNQVWTWRKL